MATIQRKLQTTSSAIFYWRSLKTKVTIFTLAIFLIGIWSLAFYSSYTLHKDMEKSLGEQQFLTASIIASEINAGLDDRLKSLEQVASVITPAMLGNAVAMQRFLEDRPALTMMFNSGIIVARIDGVAIADVPITMGRIGVNYSDRDWLAEVFKGKSIISNPVMGKKLKAPLFAIACPIRDAKGKVNGALWGVITLDKQNFLSRITDNGYGKAGDYYLNSRQSRQIVTSSDKSRIMEKLPAPGINPEIDRYMQGYEGSSVLVNPRGVEQLASIKGIPVAGWYLAVAITTAEAFAPIHTMQKRMFLAAIFLTMLAGFLTMWMLKRQLAPVFTTIKKLATLADSEQTPQPLPIVRRDEIGELIGGFNHLLETLGKREEALRESEEKHRLLFDSAGDAIFIHREAEMLAVNQAACQRLGYSRAELMSMSTGAVDTPEQSRHVPERIARLAEHGIITFETAHLRKDGSSVPTEVNARLITWDGQPAIMSICRDITERKRVEEEISAKNKELENYLYIASHDLRSPLVNIQGFSQRLQKQAYSIKAALAACDLPVATKAGMDAITDEAMPKTLNFIFSSVTKMDALLNGLLHLSRTGRTVMSLTEIDINQLLKTTIANFNFQLTEIDAKITAKDIPHCYGDASLLGQLFSNIIGNAIKCRDKNRRLVIEIAGRQELRKVIYSIRDNGLGIEPRHLGKIWDIFYRVDSTLGDAGEGLGLSIVKRIAEMHKGRVWVESEIGKGSVFYVELQTSEFSAT